MNGHISDLWLWLGWLFNSIDHMHHSHVSRRRLCSRLLQNQSLLFQLIFQISDHCLHLCHFVTWFVHMQANIASIRFHPNSHISLLGLLHRIAANRAKHFATFGFFDTLSLLSSGIFCNFFSSSIKRFSSKVSFLQHFNSFLYSIVGSFLSYVSFIFKFCPISTRLSELSELIEPLLLHEKRFSNTSSCTSVVFFIGLVSARVTGLLTGLLVFLNVVSFFSSY
ncbi:hypothetical protein BpHYR1_025244 [Brachionus plicatilis]|uniref:Uncharacterized protein n=1 Tax=Brachionus plicatilis TaxID=10195 RepID=A0A3M7PNZ4_BRAPC|nr:hypothetical protein BpHYR1_025244 [Brachionus plicatilis]